MRRTGLLVVTAACLLTWSCKPAAPDSTEGTTQGVDTPASGGSSGEPSGTAAKPEGGGPPAPAPAATGTEGEAQPPSTTAPGEPARSTQRFVPIVPRDRIARPEGVEFSKSDSGLEWAVLQTGSGAPPTDDATVRVHFTGWLVVGNRLDRVVCNSRDDRTEQEFRLRRDSMIEGWLEALRTMRRGERRWLIVPAAIGYGSQGYPGVVPPNATLAFDLQLADWE